MDAARKIIIVKRIIVWSSAGVVDKTGIPFLSYMKLGSVHVSSRCQPDVDRSGSYFSFGVK